MPQHFNAAILHRHVQKTVKHGARAAQLANYAPDIVNDLFPPHRYPELDIFERAIRTERLFRWVTGQLGGPHGAALLLLLGLAPGSAGPLERRRRLAAEVLHIQPGTFCRPHREGQLLWDLTLELYKTCIPTEPTDHEHHS